VAEPADGDRKRSTTLVIALCAAILIVGIFVGGFLVGNASTTSPTTTGTNGTTTATATTTVTSATVGVCQGVAIRCVITSSSSDTVVAGASFSFTVTTAGSPVPNLRKAGRLPRGVHFVNNHNGTATLFGSPTSTPRRSAVGDYPLVFTATFSKGAAKQVVTQEFTLTVS
jgi:hypothetical protein